MKSLLGLVVVTVLLSSCATAPYQPYAREVKKRPAEGGTLALRTNYRPEDRTKADQMMAANCGTEAIVKVSEEGEVAAGQKTTTNSDTAQKKEEAFSLGGIKFFNANSNDNSTNTQSVSQVEVVKEWQIQYNCVALRAEKTPVTPKKYSKKTL